MDNYIIQYIFINNKYIINKNVAFHGYTYFNNNTKLI